MIIEQEPIGFVYVIIVLTAFGPTILSWAPFITVSLLAIAGVWVVVTTWDPGHPGEWLIVSVAALLASSVLLRMRLRSLDALADASDLAQRLAVTDELTGLLNRHGLQAQIPRLVAMSGRLGQHACSRSSWTSTGSSSPTTATGTPSATRSSRWPGTRCSRPSVAATSWRGTEATRSSWSASAATPIPRHSPDAWTST